MSTRDSLVGFPVVWPNGRAQLLRFVLVRGGGHSRFGSLDGHTILPYPFVDFEGQSYTLALHLLKKYGIPNEPINLSGEIRRMDPYGEVLLPVSETTSKIALPGNELYLTPAGFSHDDKLVSDETAERVMARAFGVEIALIVLTIAIVAVVDQGVREFVKTKLRAFAKPRASDVELIGIIGGNLHPPVGPHSRAFKCQSDMLLSNNTGNREHYLVYSPVRTSSSPTTIYRVYTAPSGGSLGEHIVHSIGGIMTTAESMSNRNMVANVLRHHIRPDSTSQLSVDNLAVRHGITHHGIRMLPSARGHGSALGTNLAIEDTVLHHYIASNLKSKTTASLPTMPLLQDGEDGFDTIPLVLTHDADAYDPQSPWTLPGSAVSTGNHMLRLSASQWVNHSRSVEPLLPETAGIGFTMSIPGYSLRSPEDATIDVVLVVHRRIPGQGQHTFTIEPIITADGPGSYTYEYRFDLTNAQYVEVYGTNLITVYDRVMQLDVYYRGLNLTQVRSDLYNSITPYYYGFFGSLSANGATRFAIQDLSAHAYSTPHIKETRVGSVPSVGLLSSVSLEPGDKVRVCIDHDMQVRDNANCFGNGSLTLVKSDLDPHKMLDRWTDFNIATNAQLH